MQEDFVDVKEERSQPTFKWNEKYGMPVANFLRGWITHLLMDPASKFANIANFQGFSMMPGSDTVIKNVDPTASNQGSSTTTTSSSKG